jgi:hypothetical protein
LFGVALRFEGRSTRDFHDLFAYSEDIGSQWRGRGPGPAGWYAMGIWCGRCYIEDVVIAGQILEKKRLPRKMKRGVLEVH